MVVLPMLKRVRTETGFFAAGRILPLWEAAPPSWLSPALYGVLAIADGGANPVPAVRCANAITIMPIGANMAIRR